MSKPRGKKRQQPMTPGYEGRFELGRRQVDDPYEPGKKLESAVNVRASGLDYLWAREVINEAQLQAGNQYYRLFMAAELGGARAIDYSAVKVDTSGVKEPINHRALDAANELVRVNHFLGRTGMQIAEAICCHGSGMYAHFSATERRDRHFASRRVQEVLSDLVEYFDLG